MKYGIIACLVIYPLFVHAQTDSMVDSRDAELKMLRNAIKNQAAAIVPYQEKIASQKKTIQTLEAKVDQLQQQISALQDQVRQLQEQKAKSTTAAAATSAAPPQPQKTESQMIGMDLDEAVKTFGLFGEPTDLNLDSAFDTYSIYKIQGKGQGEKIVIYHVKVVGKKITGMTKSYDRMTAELMQIIYTHDQIKKAKEKEAAGKK